MLQRIYGTAWASEADLEAYLLRLEEAEKRDHRRIGQMMNLFHIQDEGKGMIFWHPKGWTLYRTLENYIRRRTEAMGYEEVKTPQVLNRSLWERSGHWEKFHDQMFVCEDDDGEVLAVKPMNCPGHVQIFNHGQRSYRDLPLRLAEYEPLHRNESSGSLYGLLRVRQMCQDDAHIFCTPDQILAESKAFVELLKSVYKDLNVELHSVKLALRPDQRFGTDEAWTLAEDTLEQAANAAGVQVERLANEGTFYGPKLEFHLRDAIGRTWQCGTLQLDYVLPERLDANYIGEDGQKHPPGDIAPGDLWVPGAVPWHPHRTLRRGFPTLVGPDPGRCGDDHLGRRRLRSSGRSGLAGRGSARGGGPAEREGRLQGA